MNHGEGSIMVCGCMSLEDIGELTRIEGKMNTKHYHDILQDKMSMLVVKFGKEAHERMFQCDNNPTHTNKLTTKWFNDHTITISTWSPQSPE